MVVAQPGKQGECFSTGLATVLIVWAVPDGCYYCRAVVQTLRARTMSNRASGRETWRYPRRNSKWCDSTVGWPFVNEN